MIDKILYYVMLGLVLIAFVVTTVSSIRRTIAERKAAGKNLDTLEKFKIVLSGVVDGVKSVEQASNQIVGDSGYKAGALKLDAVSTIAANLCAEKGIEYKEGEWTPVIELIVKLLKEEQSAQLNNKNYITGDYQK